MENRIKADSSENGPRSLRGGVERDDKLAKIREDLARVQVVIRSKDQQIDTLTKKLETSEAGNADGRPEFMAELLGWKERLDSYRSSIEKIIGQKNQEIERLKREVATTAKRISMRDV
jgi:peptidoglycan hydrolase CwlO-like protein